MSYWVLWLYNDVYRRSWRHASIFRCVCVEYCPIMSNIGNEWECTFENDRTGVQNTPQRHLPQEDLSLPANAGFP